MQVLREKVLAHYPALAGRVDRISLRHSFELLRAARMREQNEWRRHAALLAEVRNSNPRIQKHMTADEIFPALFGSDGGMTTEEEARIMRERSEERRKREMAQA